MQATLRHASLPLMFRRIIFLVWLLLTGLAKAELVADSAILPRLVSANDATIAEARLQRADSGPAPLRSEAVRRLVYLCGYVAPASRYFHDDTLLWRTVAGLLAAGQHPRGLFMWATCSRGAVSRSPCS